MGEHSTSAVPMSRIVAHELEILGATGCQAHHYDVNMSMILGGRDQVHTILESRGLEVLARGHRHLPSSRT